MERIIDLRSDTVTHPTEKMRQAMAAAPVGDDVYGEDPTVNRLEELAAQMVGKEAAMFVPSGTMGNLLALLSHTRPGDEVILESGSHIYNYEVGGLGAVAGLVPRLISAPDGIVRPGMLSQVLRRPDIHYPPTTLLCLENTHNLAGGVVTPPEVMAEVVAEARSFGLKVHLDGARVFNAAAYLKCPVTEITSLVDSVMFCLSKGLSAPVGSILAGSQEFIARARKFRKQLGGGMRQAGVLAAAGIIALEEMTQRLEEDHANARVLAEGLDKLGFGVDLTRVQTNIVFVTTPEGILAAELCSKLAPKGIRVTPRSENSIRFVTHRQITRDDIDYVLACIEEVCSDTKR